MGALVCDAIRLCDSVHPARSELSADTKAMDVRVECRDDGSSGQVMDPAPHLTKTSEVVPEGFAWPLL